MANEPKPTHFQDFTAHLLARHGSLDVGHILAAFTGIGNASPSDPEAELSADSRLIKSEVSGAWEIKV